MEKSKLDSESTPPESDTTDRPKLPFEFYLNVGGREVFLEESESFELFDCVAMTDPETLAVDGHSRP